MNTIYLAGFHDSHNLSGELFVNETQAEEYCKGKMIHVKAVNFSSEECRNSFITKMAKRWVNHIKSLDLNPASFTHEIECKHFLCEVNKVVNER